MSMMRRWLRRLAGLLLLAGLLVLLAWPREPERLSDAGGTRVHVMDGDSLRIGERIVRIEGIDAVELRQLCARADGTQWSCGLDARASLRDLVAGGGLACESHEEDRYGRAVSRCATAGTADLGAELVARGWALSGDGRGDGPYLEEEARARAGRRGIWQGRFDRPADWRAAHAP